jgi:hypothetical protein
MTNTTTPTLLMTNEYDNDYEYNYDKDPSRRYIGLRRTGRDGYSETMQQRTFPARPSPEASIASDNSLEWFRPLLVLLVVMEKPSSLLSSFRTIIHSSSRRCLLLDQAWMLIFMLTMLMLLLMMTTTTMTGFSSQSQSPSRSLPSSLLVVVSAFQVPPPSIHLSNYHELELKLELELEAVEKEARGTMGITTIQPLHSD